MGVVGHSFLPRDKKAHRQMQVPTFLFSWNAAFGCKAKLSFGKHCFGVWRARADVVSGPTVRKESRSDRVSVAVGNQVLSGEAILIHGDLCGKP